MSASVTSATDRSLLENCVFRRCPLLLVCFPAEAQFISNKPAVCDKHKQPDTCSLSVLPLSLPLQERQLSTLIIRIWSLFLISDSLEWFSLLSACSAPMDTNLLSNIHKLFSERIDIFSSVEFNKVSAGVRQSAVKVICYVQYTHSPLYCSRSL